MAIYTEEIIDNKATPITYWKYRVAFPILKQGQICANCPTDEDGNRIPQNSYTVFMDGYTTKDNRDNSEGRAPDAVKEFLIVNWEKVEQVTRPATLEEKTARLAGSGLTAEQIATTPFDIIISTEKTLYDDFDRFTKVVNRDSEAATAYQLLKANPVTSKFFEGAEDV